MPNGAFVHAMLGRTLSYSGKPDEALNHIKQGLRLDPFPAYWFYSHLGRSYRLKRQYEEALSAYTKATHLAPNAWSNHFNLAVTYALLDRQDEAEASANKVLETYPNFSVERASRTWPYKNKADVKLIVDTAIKAGLPE